MANNRFDALARAWSHRRSRRHTMALLGGFVGASIIAPKEVNAQFEGECPDGWRRCNASCIPLSRCCSDDECAPGQDCFFGICLGEEIVCGSNDDCPAFYACVKSSCVPF